VKKHTPKKKKRKIIDFFLKKGLTSGLAGWKEGGGEAENPVSSKKNKGLVNPSKNKNETALQEEIMQTKSFQRTNLGVHAVSNRVRTKRVVILGGRDKKKGSNEANGGHLRRARW